MRPEKTAIIAEVEQTLSRSSFMFLADCIGMTVDQMTELRSRLGTTGSHLMVVKNSYLGHAVGSVGWDSLSTYLEGPTAMITGAGDIAAVAKVLAAYVKERQKPAVKGGSLGGRVLTAADVAALAKIPPREVLYGQFLGTLVAPMSQLVGVMNQKMASLVYVLKAVADKKANNE